MGKNYVTWPEAREILGLENFHDLVDLQDMHPDLRLMPEEWNQFHLIPYSAEFLKRYKDKVVLFPPIDRDINGNLINFLWFNENFPGVLHISGEKPLYWTIDNMRDTHKEFISHAPEKRWHLIFKEHVPLLFNGKPENLVTHIFAAMLHYRKTGILLWQNVAPIAFSDDLDFNTHGFFTGKNGEHCALECLAGKSCRLNSSSQCEYTFRKITLPDPDPQTIVAPFPRRHNKDVCIIFNIAPRTEGMMMPSVWPNIS